MAANLRLRHQVVRSIRCTQLLVLLPSLPPISLVLLSRPSLSSLSVPVSLLSSESSGSGSGLQQLLTRTHRHSTLWDCCACQPGRGGVKAPG